MVVELEVKRWKFHPSKKITYLAVSLLTHGYMSSTSYKLLLFPVVFLLAEMRGGLDAFV